MEASRWRVYGLQFASIVFAISPSKKSIRFYNPHVQLCNAVGREGSVGYHCCVVYLGRNTGTLTHQAAKQTWAISCSRKRRMQVSSGDSWRSTRAHRLTCLATLLFPSACQHISCSPEPWCVLVHVEGINTVERSLCHLSRGNSCRKRNGASDFDGSISRLYNRPQAFLSPHITVTPKNASFSLVIP